MAILAQFRENITRIYVQKKMEKIEEKSNTQDQDEFIREIKTAFSNKSKVVNAKQKIKTFRQGKKHITNFMIEFEALAIKTKTNDMHAIFLLKKNIRTNIIKIILGYSLMAAPEILKE